MRIVSDDGVGMLPEAGRPREGGFGCYTAVAGRSVRWLARHRNEGASGKPRRPRKRRKPVDLCSARVTPSEVLGGVPHRTSLVSAGRQVRKDDIGQHL
jgi:hypothetical protein